MQKGIRRSQKAHKAAQTALPKGREYFLLHNSGAERRTLFSSQEDFDRFEAYLYLLNAVESQRAANFFVGNRAEEIFTSARGDTLLSIGAYSFVPHEFHLLVTPLVDGGVGKFMQKLQTAYTMYFNAKYGHSGRLFHGAYRAEKIETEDGLKQAFTRIHLNPAALFNAEWQTENGSELARLIMRAIEYRYSSVREYRDASFTITEPQHFPQSLRRAKDARAHFALWMKYGQRAREK